MRTQFRVQIARVSLFPFAVFVRNSARIRILTETTYSLYSVHLKLDCYQAILGVQFRKNSP